MFKEEIENAQKKGLQSIFFILLFRPQKIVSLKDRLANFELACKDSNMSPNNIAFCVYVYSKFGYISLNESKGNILFLK